MKRQILLNEDLKKLNDFQSVDLVETLQKNNPTWTDRDIENKIKEQAPYSNRDNWNPGIVKDDSIYVSVTNTQHQAIVDFSTGKTEELGKLGLGFFTDEATVNAAWTPEGIDNAKLNQMCQIAPFHEDDRKNGINEYNYKPHLDKFVIDRDRLEEEYGTREFPAMLSKCLANDANSPGGGNQGYNHLIDEMITLGVLKHDPKNSFSREDRALLLCDGTHVTLNDNILVNNTISERRFSVFQKRVNSRAQDCIDNNARHPSTEVCQNTKVPGEPVKVGAEPCVLGTEPEKKKFWETLQAYVKEFLESKKKFTPEDEAQLNNLCKKQLKEACNPDATKTAGTQVYDYMCSENVKNALRNLEGISPDKSFNAEQFCKDAAERFHQSYERMEKNTAVAWNGGNSLKKMENKINSMRAGKATGRNINSRTNASSRINDVARLR